MSTTIHGLLLQSVPYLGQKKILKIFTPDGLISVFAQKTKLDPFCLAEWVYRKGDTDLFPLQDSTLLDPLLDLRKSYPTLLAAGRMAQDLLRTQLPNKKAEELFDLALFYFRKLSSSPDLLSASFRLKVLVYEGLLSPTAEPPFTTAEWEQVKTLAFSRKLSSIQALESGPYIKIEQLFEERISNP